MNISDGLLDNFRIFPDKVALTFEGTETTYSELEALSAHAGSILSEHRVKPGDRVALVVGNVPAFPVWYYGVLRLGAIAVSVNTRLTGEEAAFILNDCEASVVIVPDGTDDEFTNDFPEIPILTVSDDGKSSDGNPLDSGDRIDLGACHPTEPNDPGTILYTSGTTGFPKGATLSHQNVRSTVHSFNHLCKMTPEDQLLLMVPAFPLLRAEHGAQQWSQCRGDDHHAACLRFERKPAFDPRSSSDETFWRADDFPTDARSLRSRGY